MTIAAGHWLDGRTIGNGRSRFRFSGTSRAFTLVELLVVLGIIAILAALLSLSTCRSIGAANAIKCAGNLKAIGTAFQLYATDHNNRLPQSVYPSANEGYHQLLLPYLNNNGAIFICPLVKNPNYPAEPTYGMNWYYDNANLATIRVSQVILATETRGADGRGSDRADEASGDPGELDSGRHGGEANYLFADGHVECLFFSATQSPVNLWGTDDGNHGQSPP